MVYTFAINENKCYLNMTRVDLVQESNLTFGVVRLHIWNCILKEIDIGWIASSHP
jgi:hypothetical protein